MTIPAKLMQEMTMGRIEPPSLPSAPVATTPMEVQVAPLSYPSQKTDLFSPKSMHCLGIPATAENRLRVSNVLDPLDYNGSPFRKSQSRSSFPLGEYGSNGFTERFRGKQIHASQHLYRMQSCMNGLFPGLKKCPPNAFLRKFYNFRRPLRVTFPQPKKNSPYDSPITSSKKQLAYPLLFRNAKHAPSFSSKSL